jgi:hypothetical protein
MKVVTEEEMKQLSELRETIISIITSLGEIRLNKLVLKEELSKLDAQEQIEENSYKVFQQNERVLFEQFKAKYGTSNIDLVTGEITD